MDRYAVNPVNIEGNFFWELYETSTDQVIDQFFFEEDAVDTANFMERGGAFAGWTPSFILREVAAPRDLNHEFTAFISD